MVNGASNRIAIIGASGYGGLQSIRLLKDHPKFDITYLGAKRNAGKAWNDFCPYLPLDHNPLIEEINIEKISEVADFAILSLPNGLASDLVPDLLDGGLRVVDLSADYRYRSLEQWNQIYLKEASVRQRNDKHLCLEAVYGLSEWNFSKIKTSRLVASPGCFPTASLLPILPFLNQGLLEYQGIIIDSKTGTSGGGRTPQEKLLLSEAAESIAPYGVIGHRHTSEIEQLTSEVTGQQTYLQFTPHLVPMAKGLLSTVYGRLRDPGLTAEDCRTVLDSFYRNQPCIEVLPVGIYPATKWVRNTNRALLSVQVDNRNGRVIFTSVIDNLIKGQAGQGIQNLNIMAGYEQELGLPLVTFYP